MVCGSTRNAPFGDQVLQSRLLVRRWPWVTGFGGWPADRPIVLTGFSWPSIALRLDHTSQIPKFLRVSPNINHNYL